MKNIILILLVIFAGHGCATELNLGEVSIEWFNLSEIRIKVVDVGGMPPNVMPGVLSPSPNETLATATSVVYGPVHIKGQINIFWQQDGNSHKAEFKRDDCGIPAKLSSGKIRFTYLGNDKWRVKYFSK